MFAIYLEQYTQILPLFHDKIIYASYNYYTNLSNVVDA